MVKKYLYALVVFALMAGNCLAAPKKIIVDTTRVQPVEISEETEQKIFSDKAYIYKEEELKRGRNFLGEFWDWLTKDRSNQEKEEQDRSNRDYSRSSGFWNSSWVGNFLIFLCILAVAGGIVYLLVSGKWKVMFTPKPMETPFDFKEVVEDIEGLNINKLIEEARLKGDYRLATRWWYLKILQKFTACELINWKPHKTNFEYYKELQHTKYIEAFKNASRIYEYVWYGETPVDETMYANYTPQLAELEKNIHA